MNLKTLEPTGEITKRALSSSATDSKAASAAAASSKAIPVDYLTHELRAPVTAIRLGLEILQEQTDGRLAADEKQLLSLALKNTARLAGLINDIMDHSKLMAGRMRIMQEACDPAQIVSEAVSGLSSWADKNGIRLIAQVEPGLRAWAEPRRVVQVITNLLSNALKFTPAGGTIRVCVSKGSGADAGALVFSVSDTGCGIARKDQASIFEAFEQAAQDHKKTDGTGLGLALARAMVELHGGQIRLESELGRGTTFSFTIPAVRTSSPQLGKLLPAGWSVRLASFCRQVNMLVAALL